MFEINTQKGENCRQHTFVEKIRVIAGFQLSAFIYIQCSVWT